MGKPKGSGGFHPGHSQDLLGDIWDGERWSFVPQQDFDVPTMFISGWVEETVAVNSGDPYETPSLNYLLKSSGLPSLSDRAEHGWSAFALRLRAMAELMDIPADIVQENVRNKAGDLLETRYVFQAKEKE